MKKFETLEYLIISEIKSIRICISFEDRQDLIKEFKENNIYAKYSYSRGYQDSLIEFETHDDLMMFKLKYKQISGKWSQLVLENYKNYDSFERYMIFDHNLFMTEEYKR